MPLIKICPNCEAMFMAEDIRAKYCGEACRERSEKKRHYDKHESVMARPFRAWDGEGEGDRYTLLANSDGQYLWDRKGLESERCFDFILRPRKASNNVWFSFGYDINMMLKDVPLEKLEELCAKNKVKWGVYWICYIPRKSFQLSGRNNSYTGFDVFGFFQKKFTGVIDEWLKVKDEIIEEGKAARGGFADWDKAKIVSYNAAECRMLVDTMDKFRNALIEAGLPVKRWDGAGAVAAVWLERHNVTSFYGPVPADMEAAVEHAYFGGRIDIGGWGLTGGARARRRAKKRRVWHYDINSAYPNAFKRCPDMSKLRWKLVQYTGKEVFESPDFSLWHVKWNCNNGGRGQWWPFPWRAKDGSILYPREGEGWYWGVEVKAALRRFSEGIQIIEGWVPVGPLEYPLWEAIEHDYEFRARMKREGNPANIPLKLALNSLYGKCAQRIGFGGKRPKYYNLAWAGFVTAYTRAMLQDALRMCHGNAVLVMTDGIWSMEEIGGLDIGKGLGQWTWEEEDISVCIIGAGLYESYTEEGIHERKQRGFGKADIDYIEVVRLWEGKPVNNNCLKGPCRECLTKFGLSRFVGIKLALHAPKKWGDKWRQFIDMEREISDLNLVGTSKRMPGVVFEKVEGGIHWLNPRGRTEPVISYRYDSGLEEKMDSEVLEERLGLEGVEDE